MDKDFRFLDDLFLAISTIEDEYCNWEYQDSLQQTERVFAYELYYKLKLISNIKTSQYAGIKFNGEIGKKIFNDISNLGTVYTVDQKDFNPDLVLHLNQIDSSSENQKLIIEIKTKNKSDEDVAKDIIKLNYGIEHLNFQFGVFISVNTNFETIIKKLRTIFILENLTQEDLINFNSIYIANYKSRKLDILTLDKILLLYQN